MAQLGDSLVIRILADSSELQSALDEVLGRFESLQSRVEDVVESTGQLSRLGSVISAAQAPLQTLSRLFGQVQSQASALSQTVVTLNVSPALGALSALAGAIAQVQAQLRGLAASAAASSLAALPFPVMGGSNGPIRQFAGGGLVDGPTGIDRVPAMLTAGEFVLNREAVQRLGIPFLQQMNSRPESIHRDSSRGRSGVNEVTGTSFTTHFGGVTVQVQQAAELSAVLETLQLEEVHVRNRRG